MQKNRGKFGVFDKIERIIKSKLSRELIVYIIAGVLTTLVNFISYYIAKPFFSSETVCNIIAWAVSVLFAYFVNSRFVFLKKPESIKTEIKLLSEFAGARVLSGAVETSMVFIFIEKLNFNDFIIKVLLSVFVVVFNYVVSKLWIFKDRK